MGSIPRIPSPGRFSGKDWCTADSGKGDKPRNISDQFKDNYDDIKWRRKKKKSKTGFSRTVYK